MCGTPGGSQRNVGSALMVRSLFSSAVLALNRAWASGNIGGIFPATRRPPPTPPNQSPERSCGRKAESVLAGVALALEAGAWARRDAAKTSATAAMERDATKRLRKNCD